MVEGQEEANSPWNQQRSLSIADGKKPLMNSGQKEDAAAKKRGTTDDDDAAPASKANPYSISSSSTTTTTTDTDSDDTNHTYSKPTGNFSQWSLHNNETDRLDAKYNIQNQTGHTSLLPAEAPPTTWYNGGVLGLWAILIVVLLGATIVKKYRARKRQQYQEIVNTSLVV